MRQYLANQALETGKPIAKELLGRSPSQIATYGSGGMFFGDSAQASKIGESPGRLPSYVIV